MQLFASFVLALSFALSFIPPALAHAHQGRHHAHRQVDLARRSSGEISLYKRFDNARLSYYAVGLGACGSTSVASDFVVALDIALFTQGSYCFQAITITVDGKTAGATIVDECPGCPPGGLDLSQGLFEYFADVNVGIIYGTWEPGSGSSPPSSSSPPSATSFDIPLTTLLAPSTTTSQPSSATTSSWPTSSSSYNSTTVSSNTSSLVPTQTTTGIVSESAGPSADGSVLVGLNLALVELGRLLVASVDPS